MGLMALSEIATLPTPKYSMPSYAAITNNTYWKLDGDGKYLSRKVFQDEFGDEALQLVTLSGEHFEPMFFLLSMLLCRNSGSTHLVCGLDWIYPFPNI